MTDRISAERCRGTKIDPETSNTIVTPQRDSCTQDSNTASIAIAFTYEEEHSYQNPGKSCQRSYTAIAWRACHISEEGATDITYLKF